jgi:hypothetical protein
MSSCPPNVAPPSPVMNAPGPLFYGGTDVTPVLRNNTPPVITNRHETDARTALTRGLAMYLRGLEFDGGAGRILAFGNRVFDSYADPEVQAAFPSALVSSDTPGTYDASRLTPGEPVDRVQAFEGNAIYATSEFVMDMVIDIWATEPRSRMALVAGMEQALSPTDWMYGLRLDLPFYFGARAGYELQSVQYIDSEESATRRYRRASMVVSGRVPVYRFAAKPLARPRLALDVTTAASE